MDRILERTFEAAGRRQGPCRNQACLSGWKPLSHSLDTCCSGFISTYINEFITPWGSALPKCNVLPLLSVWGVSIESTFIILTFRLPQRGASFLGPSQETFVPPAEWGDWRSFSFFLKFCSRGLDKKASSRGILNENKNQLGHGLVTIWGAAVWRSERKEGVLRWLEWLEKAHTNQICSGVFFEDKNYGFKVKHKTLALHYSLTLNVWSDLYFYNETFFYVFKSDIKEIFFIYFDDIKNYQHTNLLWENLCLLLNCHVLNWNRLVTVDRRFPVTFRACWFQDFPHAQLQPLNVHDQHKSSI